MDHRRTSLKFLAATGLIPVKVRPGQKDPFPEWDPRQAVNEDHTATMRSIESTPEMNLGALFSGKFIDIDVDSTSTYLQSALDYFLPRTPYVWGRKSKPRSHRVYALHENFDRAPWGPVLRFIKGLGAGKVDDESYSVEIRGGKPENGLFSVLPGSVHPSGEHVEWDAEVDPSVGGVFVDIEQIIRGVRLAVAASLVAPHWVEGARNDISLALAGTLWRIRTATRAAYGLEPDEESPAGYFVLTEDDAKGIFNAIMRLSGDDKGDERSRILNLVNTWKKLDGESASKVTGGKVLGELIGGETGPNVVKTLYRLLSDNDAAEQIEKLAEQFVMWYGAGVLIDLKLVTSGRMTPWMTKDQAYNSLGGKKLIIGNKKIRLADMLFNSTIINRVWGLTFDPSNPELVVPTPNGPMVNQWQGWAVEPCPQRVSDEEIEPFLSYVKEVVADNQQDRYDWVLAWMADMLQLPASKPGTALVLVGVQGAGKSFLGEQVLGKIIGEAHYAQINSITKLTDKFNTIIDNKIFLQCDEAIHSYQRDISSRLKSIITDGSVIIEPKGVNSYRKPNHLHILFTSNEETQALFIDPSPFERRFTVLKVNSSRAADLKYWQFMHIWTPMALPKIMRWLMDYKYERNQVIRPLMTKAKEDVQRVGVDPEVSWILNRITSGFPLADNLHSNWYEAFNTKAIDDKDKKHNTKRRDTWPDRVMTSLLEQDFKSFVRGHGKQIYSGSVITNIRKVLPAGALSDGAQLGVRSVDPRSGQTTLHRIRLSSFPVVEDILNHLRFQYGAVIDKLYDDLASANSAEDLGETEIEAEY